MYNNDNSELVLLIFPLFVFIAAIVGLVHDIATNETGLPIREVYRLEREERDKKLTKNCLPDSNYKTELEKVIEIRQELDQLKKEFNILRKYNDPAAFQVLDKIEQLESQLNTKKK